VTVRLYLPAGVPGCGVGPLSSPLTPVPPHVAQSRTAATTAAIAVAASRRSRKSGSDVLLHPAFARRPLSVAGDRRPAPGSAVRRRFSNIHGQSTVGSPSLRQPSGPSSIRFLSPVLLRRFGRMICRRGAIAAHQAPPAKVKWLLVVGGRSGAVILSEAKNPLLCGCPSSVASSRVPALRRLPHSQPRCPDPGP
jgi:hypothetical protein